VCSIDPDLAGCLNVFGMAVGSFKTRLRRLCWSPLRAPIDTLPDCRHSGIPEFAGHLVPKQLCCFLFYQARAGACVRDKRNGAPQAVLAARGKQVAFGQTARTSYAGRTTRGGSATSRFAGSLAVHVAGAGSRDAVPAAHVGSAARQGQCPCGVGTRPDTGLLPMRSTHAASGYRVGFLDSALWVLTRRGSALSVPRLQRRTPAPAGSIGCGTGAHQRFTGTSVSRAGRSRTIYPGGAISWAAVRGQDHPMGIWKVVQRLGEVGRPP